MPIHKHIRHIVGVTGAAGSGKDTVGEIICDNYKNWHRHSFAKPVYYAVAAMFGIRVSDLHDRAYKEKVHPYWGISPREMLQKLGTEGGRELFFQDIWIKRAMQTVVNYPMRNYIFTDVRFENEATWIRENGSLLHIMRPSTEPVRAHFSEKGIEKAETDYMIMNNSNKKYLKEVVLAIIDHIIGQESWEE